ncbi:MAG: (d)CMP kinase [Clostridia bacterium]|nr:(d)CMP kinase [Clostridia bacterium]
MDIKKIRIALDGPSGAGKSTIAKKIAEKLGIVYVDTGALYRTVGLYSIENGISDTDTEGIIASLQKIDLRLAYEDGTQKVYLNGVDVGDRIRTPLGSKYAAAVSKIPEVRAFLLDVQRNIAAGGGVIMDGRDIGTVIMPDAELKVFMTATAEARAKRRCLELEEKGMPQPYDEVLADIIARDKSDSEREASPCVPAEDAILFVNDEYGIEESADFIIDLAAKAVSA